MKKKIINEDMKWALSFLKPYIWGLFGVLVLGFSQNYAYTLLPGVSTRFLFGLINPENIQLLFKYFYFAIAIIVLKAFLSFIRRYGMRIIAHSANKRVRDTLFTHLMVLDIDFFTQNKTGDILSIGINDIERIRIDLFGGIIGFFNSIIMLIIITVRLSLLNWMLTLVCFAILPFLYLVITLIGNKMRLASKKLRRNLSDLSTNIHETLTGIEVVKAFAQEEYEIENFKKNTKGYKKTFLHLARLSDIFGPLNEVIIYLFVIGLVGIGSLFIVREMWSAQKLAEYLVLLGIMAVPGFKIPRYIANFKIVSAPIERVTSILAKKPKIIEEENPITRDIEGKVEFRNVDFSYEPSKKILHNISFIVEKGEIVALVGPSGGGKTTIANLIPRFYDCSSGNILVDDFSVKDYALYSLRSQIGIVSQNVILFNTTIAENIKYPKKDATDEEIIEAAKMAYAYDFIMNLPDQFNTQVGEKGVRLSGGQKQRVAIARTILMNPQILILDEATSALDSESEHYIQLAVNKLMENRTTITIAHRLSTIAHAKKILVIENGKIVEVGKHEDLLNTCELYKKIYNLQYFR